MLYLNYLLQDPSSPFMVELVGFHKILLSVLLLISLFVFFILSSLWLGSWVYSGFLHKEAVETVWTVVPMLILLLIAFPSLHLLFLSDAGASSPAHLAKVVGRQWYWHYDYYFDHTGLSYDSFAVSAEDAAPYEMANLEADKPLIFLNQHANIILTCSADVLHCFALPSAAMKMDCVPGRLNQVSFFPLLVGKFYGQCSEMCGANHSFMPICAEVVEV